MSVEAGLPALALIVLLGMRHGLEPDHLAAVDGLTLRSHAAHPRWTPWMGALFALGHGVCVLAIVAVAALASQQLSPSEAVFGWLEWLPIALLLLFAGLNARSLLAAGKLDAAWSLPESWMAALGGAMVLLMAALYGWTLHGLRRVRA